MVDAVLRLFFLLGKVKWVFECLCRGVCWPWLWRCWGSRGRTWEAGGWGYPGRAPYRDDIGSWGDWNLLEDTQVNGMVRQDGVRTESLSEEIHLVLRLWYLTQGFGRFQGRGSQRQYMVTGECSSTVFSILSGDPPSIPLVTQPRNSESALTRLLSLLTFKKFIAKAREFSIWIHSSHCQWQRKNLHGHWPLQAHFPLNQLTQLGQHLQALEQGSLPGDIPSLNGSLCPQIKCHINTPLSVNTSIKMW